ncbi:MAG: hypothetical protein CMP83_08455, partial [Gammaproteobacteria bacterium]|nr:hypothetical protein [Gammaproteobacteria bacterium]
FDAALREIEAAGAARDTHPELFRQWDACRTKKCVHCKASQKKTHNNPDTLTGRCKFYWYELRKAPCTDCGRDDGYSEYDHQEERGEKRHNLGDYCWWVWNGGVEAMRAEAAKCVPRCRNCHQMQPSNNKYKRKYATLDDMPTDTPAQRIKKHTRRYLDEKIAFVDERKLAIGECAECELRVTPATCHVFAFAHMDASTKTRGVAQLCNSHASLPTARPALEEEMGKCRLLCAVCHSKETRARNIV